jgi:hypothetical protein
VCYAHINICYGVEEEYMKVEDEIQRLSDASGTPKDAILAEVNASVKAGKSMEGAVGEWAAKNSLKLNRPKPADYDFVVITAGNARPYVPQTGDGAGVETLRRFVTAFVCNDLKKQDYSLKSIIVYGDNAGKDMRKGQLWHGTLTLSNKGDLAFVKKGSDLTPSSVGLLPLSTLMKQLDEAGGIVPVSNATEFVGKSGFFKGSVVRAFNTANGQGFNMYSMGGNPVTAWPIDGVAPKEGADVMVHANCQLVDGVVNLKFAVIL